MSYYTQSSYTSTWHRAADPRTFVMIIQPKQVGAEIPGAWMGSSETPALPGNGLAWALQGTGLHCAVAPAALPFPLCPA